MYSPSRLLMLTILVGLTLFAVGCSDEQSSTVGSLDQSTAHLNIKSVPAGYYDTVDFSTPANLRSTLHLVIDDHTKIPYTATGTDTWNVLEIADQDPNDSSHILDVYLNASYIKYGEGNLDYNREHTWPKSYGFPDDLVANYPYTDCHHLFLCNDSYNTSRSNKPYRYGTSGDLEKPTEINDGMGGGTGFYPGNSNWTSGSLTEGTWETWTGRRGDVARALLYMDVRYEGGTHGVTGHSEPDLILTDNESLIAASNTGSMESVAYMGMLSVLLEWHTQDPVDTREIARNEAVYSYQGNRNPFIDHPEWVECLFSGICGGSGDVTPPAAPTGLLGTAGDGYVNLDWADNSEGDLAGYTVYRGVSSGGPYSTLNGTLLTASQYSDGSVTNGQTYYYVITASDDSANDSAASAEASATPSGPVSQAAVWINEFHYDNDGTDTGEFFEIAGPAGTSLSGWTVYGYNGNGGVIYDTEALSGTLPDQNGGYGTLSFAMAGMQNGSPDGLALADGSGTVVQYISYEGQITATDGPASGSTSTDIGVSEPSDSPVGWSLQLAGSGTTYADFTWQSPMAGTPGSLNTGQDFGGSTEDTTPPAAPTGLAATANDGSVDLNWDNNSEPDLDGYVVYRATSSGGSYSAVSSLLGASSFTDASVSNGTTYFYVVTASDLTGNESGYGSEASATPEAVVQYLMHVQSISATSVVISRKEYGEAAVLVVDSAGNPLSGVTVEGTFSGGLRGTYSAVSGADGYAVVKNLKGGKIGMSFTFCVNDLAISGWTYDSSANVVTCSGN